jgi:hypothetical protein
MSLPSDIYVVGRGTSGDPTLDTPADGAVIPAGATVNFSGTGPIISQPIVEIREFPAGVSFAPWCYGNVIGPAGTWSCPPSTTLNPGEWEVRVSTEDVNGVVTTSTPIRVTQHAPPTTPTLTVPAVGGYDTLASTLIVGGNYAFGSLPGGSGGQIIVTVTDPNGDDTDYCDTFATGAYNPAATAWTCSIPLAVGVNDVSMRIQDPVTLAYTLQSNSVAVRRGTADPTTLTSPANGSIVSTPLTFAGAGPALGNLEVQYRKTGTLDAFTTECTNQVDDTGSWACFEAIPVGEWDVQVTATDLMGGVTTTPITSFTAGYDKPAMTYTPTGTNAISAHALSLSGGWVTMYLYSVDYTSDPTQYSWGAPIPTGCPANIPIQITCTLGGTELAPGIWNVLGVDEFNNPPTAIGSAQDDYFYVPQPPTLTPAPNANGTVTVSVTREAGTLVTVRDLATSAAACTISGAGTAGNCTFPATEGSHQYTAQAQSVGFVADTGSPGQPADDSFDWYSGVATSAAILVPAAPPVPAASPNAPPTPTPTRAPWTWSFSSDGDGIYFPGDRVSFTGQGVPARSEILFELHSTVRSLGSVIATEDGTFAFTAIIPADAEAGEHHFVLTALAPGEAPSVLEAAVEIQHAPVEPVAEPTTDEPVEEALGETGSGSGSSETARDEPAAPTALSEALPTLSRIVDDPFVLLTAGGLGIALLFLVAIPAELLNSTLSSNTGRLGRGFRAVEGVSDRIRDWFIRITRSRALAAALLVIAVSIIFGFVDPAFGFDLASLRLVLSLSIAFFILSYGTSWLTGIILRRTSHAESAIVIQPAVILFAIAGVVLARLLDFAPGFLVGLVIGLELARAARRTAAMAVLVQFGLILALAIGAWVGYSVIADAGGADDFLGALLNDTLVAVTAEGLMAIFVAALPLKFLEGRDLWTYSKPIWFVTFFVIAFAFALIVLPTAMSTTDGAEIGVWVAVFAGFGLITVILWAIFAMLDRRAGGSDDDLAAPPPREMVDA